jgi:hypothetical protein
MSQALEIAPRAKLVHSLVVFQRAFLSIEDYTQRGIKPGMLLGGYLADALHTIPKRLFHYSDDSMCAPADTLVRLDSLPDNIRVLGAPDDIVEDCRRILTKGGAEEEIGLKDDHSDFDLAPEVKLTEYFDLLSRAFSFMSAMKNLGNPSAVSWFDLDRVWTEAAFAQAAINGFMASVLSPLPLGLMRWSHFREDAFILNTLNVAERLSVENRGEWLKIFGKD